MGAAPVWKADGTQIANVQVGVVEIWDILTGRQVALLSGGEIGRHPYEWAVLDDERMSAAYSVGYGASIRHHDLKTGRTDWILTYAGNGQFVKFGPDGRVLDGNPDFVDREFVCLIEEPTGATTPAEAVGFPAALLPGMTSITTRAVNTANRRTLTRCQCKNGR